MEIYFCRTRLCTNIVVYVYMDIPGAIYFHKLYFLAKRLAKINEPRHEKTNVLHMRKQRRRSASR